MAPQVMQRTPILKANVGKFRESFQCGMWRLQRGNSRRRRVLGTRLGGKGKWGATQFMWV